MQVLYGNFYKIFIIKYYLTRKYPIHTLAYRAVNNIKKTKMN